MTQEGADARWDHWVSLHRPQCLADPTPPPLNFTPETRTSPSPGGSLSQWERAACPVLPHQLAPSIKRQEEATHLHPDVPPPSPHYPLRWQLLSGRLSSQQVPVHIRLDNRLVLTARRSHSTSPKWETWVSVRRRPPQAGAQPGVNWLRGLRKLGLLSVAYLWTQETKQNDLKGAPRGGVRGMLSERRSQRGSGKMTSPEDQQLVRPHLCKAV